MQLIFSIFLVIATSVATAQSDEKPFIKLVNGTKESNKVSSARQFVVGSTCKSCKLTINNQPVKVYNTGAFAFELTLSPGDTSFEINAAAPSGKPIIRKISYNYQIPKPATAVSSFEIESIETIPEGNLVLKAGDKISFKVKALPGSTVNIFKNIRLYEMPVGIGNSLPGIYKGEYVVQPADSFNSIRIPVTLSKDGQTIQKESKYQFSVMSPLASDVAVTKGRLAHLEYGLGEDRLGGAKIGYLDSAVLLKIVGKSGGDYKLQLAPSLTAYIPEDLVTLLPKGSPGPQSLTGAWSVYGDEKYDYVTVSLNAKLPYQSFQETDPSRIIVDIYGATNNTNWISQLQSAKEVEKVDYEQLSDEIFRVKIKLKHKQHWGHQLYYRGNTLVIKIKQQPTDLSLSKLTIAVDAGHGGSNTGAGGPTGSSEKQLALAVSLKLQRALIAEGAKVIMTRTTEKFVDNKERILFYRDSVPDLLISVHLNSSSDPIRAGGTSTHYRYVGFQKLSELINKRMQELGLKQYGVVGSFNFMLNSPTEYPNCLVETLFLSNPAEEAMMLDENFQEQMAQKILMGIKDFLTDIK
ncbi:MAG: N-acetylmuramoyl-L-alanine amidase [Chitinophagaceae bacterium]|nr:MAG: N-acetylmuramoyl-L-alanine amidase [Chitinophagaceae bacterium]